MKHGKGELNSAKKMHWSKQTPFFNNTRDNFTHGHQEMVNPEIELITFFVAKDGEVVCSQQKRDLEMTVAQDHELLIAKFRLKLKKVGKTNRPARYDLNQIPNEYAVEVMNRFKGFDLVNRVPEELLMEASNIVQETANKTIPVYLPRMHWS